MEITIILLTIVLVMASIATAIAATRFEYRIDAVGCELIVTWWWGGLVPIRRTIDCRAVEGLERVGRALDLSPILGRYGLPQIWGGLRVDRMIVVRTSGWIRLFPMVVTPERPDEFFSELSSCLAKSRERESHL
jgi:hypothetical protein